MIKLLYLFLVVATSCEAQIKPYADRNICITSEVHKGKVNHGKPYCVGWATVREYTDGRKDTIGWMTGQKFIGNDYKDCQRILWWCRYQTLPERSRYIVDSLKEDGIPQLSQSYLTYKPIYMKSGKETEWFWKIEGETIKTYQYLFWNNGKGFGFKLLKQISIN